MLWRFKMMKIFKRQKNFLQYCLNKHENNCNEYLKCRSFKSIFATHWCMQNRLDECFNNPLNGMGALHSALLLIFVERLLENKTRRHNNQPKQFLSLIQLSEFFCKVRKDLTLWLRWSIYILYDVLRRKDDVSLRFISRVYPCSCLLSHVFKDY